MTSDMNPLQKMWREKMTKALSLEQEQHPQFWELLHLLWLFSRPEGG